jgi:3-oxoacyl-[acyl-carrier protein] reductase
MQDLKDAVALVTGASRGLGKGIAIALARAGANVAVNYVSREVDARAVVAEIETLGRRAIPIQADVSLKEDVDRLVAETIAAFGPINILVNNAGILGVVPGNEVTEAEWNKVIAVNLTSAFLVTEAVLPSMREAAFGRIINLSSVAAQIGGATSVHYGASKAGLLGLTHSYASKLARSNITVNALAPALVETDMVTAGLKASPDRLPVGRFGTIEETGETAVLLARNGFITGQTINLNGGLYMS